MINTDDFITNFIGSSFGILLISIAFYVFVQAMTLPYQNQTDRLWKTEDGDDEKEAE